MKPNRRQRIPRLRFICMLHQWRGAAGVERLGCKIHMKRFLAILIGTLLIGVAVYGAKRGKAFIGYFFSTSIERKDEPVGFWIAVVAQVAMGVTAE